MRKINLMLTLGLGLLLTVSACKKRKNPTDPIVLKQPNPGYLTTTGFGHTWPALDNPPLGNPFSVPSRSVVVAIPGEVPIDDQGHVPPTWRKKYPVLYFLTDFGQDAVTFVETYRIHDIADELTAKGEIQPMIIVIADGNNPIGGGFYVNSIGGNYEKYVAEDLRLQIDTLFFTRIVLNSANKRGISGLGMGGYAAFRVGMDYPGFYSSVSAISAPLSIEAGAFGDWFNDYLWPTAIQEGLRYTPRDSVPIPPDINKPATSLLYAMALGFSAHDTLDTDFSSFFKIEKMPQFRKDFGVDLPYDSVGNLRVAVWNKWQENDIKYRLINIKPGSLVNTKIYFEVGDQDSYHLQIANRNFNSFMATQSYSYSFNEFTGYSGFPADHFNYAYDRLVAILKFHSKNF